MTVHTRRYRQVRIVSDAKLQSVTEGTVVQNDAGQGLLVDYDYDDATASATDLDEELFEAGFDFIEEDPADTPDQAGVDSERFQIVSSELRFSDNMESTMDTFIGAFLETIRITVTESVGVVSLNLDQDGGGDLTIIFTDGYFAFDTTPAKTVTLTVGTDTVPTINYVYVLQSTKTLTASTVSFPSAEHAPVATVFVQSASGVSTDGVYKLHAWTDHTFRSGNNGHLSHINQWIRSQNATWKSGVNQTLTITPNGGSPDNVIFTTASGITFQLHEHTFPAFGGTPDLFVVNDSVTPFTKVTDLNALLTDALGASMSGRYFSLVIWGAVNQNTGDSKLFVNLPLGSYINSNGVTQDTNKFAVFTIPIEFRGVGFLISELKLRHQVAASGTWTSVQEVDLRGQFPSIAAGSGISGGSEFLDTFFRIQDDGDDTKEIAFQASSITTATTRTISMPDVDVTLGAGGDTTAIHDDTAAEISVITEKITPVSADLIIIEDSADTNAKKRVQIGNLPGSFLTSVDSERFQIVSSELQLSDNMEVTMDVFVGAFLETIRITVTESVGVVTLNLDKDGGGDLTIIFTDGYFAYDTTPADTATLTTGTDTSPTINYVYVLQSTKTLTVSTAGFPVTEHAPVATVLVQSASSVSTDGVYKLHAWTDHTSQAGNNGHLSHINRWVRSQHATWESGVVQTLTITPNGGAADNVIFTTAAGVAFQLHSHTFPAFSGTPDLFVINDSVTPFDKIADLNVLLTDALGVSMSARYFSLVIWGVVNENTGDCKLFVNLPLGSYNNSGGVTQDNDKFAVFTIPPEFRGVGFLISELKLRHQTAASGTWTSVQEVDLRGFMPTIPSGGGAAITSEFLDSLFRIQDDGDNTKEIAFQASTITTGTTRTVTMPDTDVTLGAGGDTTAIHDDTAAEISVITEKATPVNADLLLIEDSAAANVKKRVQIGNLPASGSLPVYLFSAEKLSNPLTADWAVNALAPLAEDSNNSGILVRLFDDTTEEGIGFTITVPSGAASMQIFILARAETGPGGAVVAKLLFYEREISDNAAVTAWSSSIALTDVALPVTTEFFQEDETDNTLATWGLTAGKTHQIQITRTSVSDTLTGDLALVMLRVEFT